MRSELAAVVTTIMLAGATLAGGGCAMTRTVLDDSATDRFGDADGELDFWDDLATRPVVTNHDALHALLMMTSEEPPRDYEARLAEARRRAWIDGDARPSENESASVGMIAMAVCDLIGVEGGLTLRLFGPSPRFCTREIVFLGLIPPRTENQALSGLEFIDLVSRVERFHEPEGDA